MSRRIRKNRSPHISGWRRFGSIRTAGETPGTLPCRGDRSADADEIARLEAFDPADSANSTLPPNWSVWPSIGM